MRDFVLYMRHEAIHPVKCGCFLRDERHHFVAQQPIRKARFESFFTEQFVPQVTTLNQIDTLPEQKMQLPEPRYRAQLGIKKNSLGNKLVTCLNCCSSGFAPLNPTLKTAQKLARQRGFKNLVMQKLGFLFKTSYKRGESTLNIFTVKTLTNNLRNASVQRCFAHAIMKLAKFGEIHGHTPSRNFLAEDIPVKACVQDSMVRVAAGINIKGS